jgi:RimJ/RimL family protein N-acetyltransferase
MQTDMMSLRKPEWKDISFIRQLWSDEATMRPVGGPVVMTDEQAANWYASKIDPGNPSDCYRLIMDQEHRPVGEISYRDLDPETRRAHFNIKIMHVERGKGYAKGAMRIFLDEFFNQHGGRLMLDDVAPDNIAGQELLFHFGFEHDPGPGEVFRMRLTRERFNALHRQAHQPQS